MNQVISSRAAKAQNRKNALFAAGSGCYSCRCCNRSTRSTGRGDNEMVNMCSQCFDLAGEENSLSDSGKLYCPTSAREAFFQLVKFGKEPAKLFPEVAQALNAIAA